MISGFRRDVAENCALLGYYEVNSGKKASSGNFVTITCFVITQKISVLGRFIGIAFHLCCRICAWEGPRKIGT